MHEKIYFKCEVLFYSISFAFIPLLFSDFKRFAHTIDSHQLILVLTDSASTTKGYLYRFERQNQKSSWELTKEKIPVVLGRNGLAWGRGLHPIDSALLPIKTEGDGKSPAGVFTLSSAFGYAASKK